MPAESPSPEPNRRTLLASVVFADIVGYSKRVVSQQIDIKTQFNAMISRAVEHVTKPDRMILDTGDGCAICFLGDPEDALIAATNLRAASLGTEVALRLGINLGPVKIVKDVNGRPNLLGDGINDAQRVMSFSKPNQILVSRTYFEVLSRLSQEYSRLFTYAGVHRDKHVREHEVYLVAQGDGAPAEEMAEPVAEAPAPVAAAAPPPAPAGPPAVAVAPPPPSPMADKIALETEFVPAPPAMAAEATAPHFEPAVLAHVETVLARVIGPLARVIVNRTAQTATDIDQLCKTVAASVPESKQRDFLRDVAARLKSSPPSQASGAPQGAAPATPASATPGSPSPAPKELPAEVLAKATERLAQYLGPVAKMIVKKTAGQATSARDLYERLAQQIDDPRTRERWINEMGAASSGPL